jgi:hypothetical protein
MTPELATGMLERGELTPEQFAEMGYAGDEVLPSYDEANANLESGGALSL